jgi:membrane protease YdiL (CAAX protease family)
MSMTDALSPRRAPYGPVSTLLLGSLLCGVLFLAQAVAMGAFMAVQSAGKIAPGQFASMSSRGDVLSVAACVSAVAVGAASALLVWLRRGPSLADYLALRAVSGSTIALTALLALGLAVLGDAWLKLLGRPLVHPSMRHALETSGNLLPLLGVAIVVAAPISEELLFRGFVYRGWLLRMPSWLVALLTAVLWAALHVQYGPAELVTIVVWGLVLGELRRRTNSLWPPLFCHALLNLIACMETLLL